MTYDSYNLGDWDDAEGRAERAHELYDRGHWADALHELDAAIDINPHNANWLFNKGLTLDTLERYQDAVEAYKLAQELDGDDPEIQNCLGIDYTRLGQYDLALHTFEQIQQAHPDFEPAYCNRIITYAELGQHDKAEEMFYLARQVKEDCPLCYYNIGNSLFSRQKYDRAIWCWLQTKHLDPAHPAIDYRIAQAHWAKGQPQEAKQHFLAELRRSPGDVEVLLDAGILMLEINELDAAREKFHRILEIDPRHAQAHHYLGEFHLHEGNLTQALEAFNQAVALEPNLAGVHYRLGECHLLLGQQDNAREHLLLELRCATNHPEVLLDLGCLLQQIGQTAEAMTCFERAIEADPSDPRPYHNLSLCYYQSGLLEQGADLSVKVLERDPQHLPALHNLAYIHLKLGYYDQAQEYALRAAHVAPNQPQWINLRRSIALRHACHRSLKPLRRLAGLVRTHLLRRQTPEKHAQEHLQIVVDTESTWDNSQL